MFRRNRSRSRRGSTNQSKPSVEQLEARCLLAAALVDGIWSIGPSDPSSDDNILIDRHPAHPKWLQAFVNGELVDTRRESSLEGIKIQSGAGNDRVLIATASDIDLPTTIIAGAGADWIKGSAGDDRIDGGPGKDTIRGGNGSDSIWGGRGADDIEGNTGDDQLGGGRQGDVVRGGKGRDSLNGGLGNDTLKGGSEDDVLRGGRKHDLLYGGSGNDSLRGSRGADQLFGSEGNDILFGELDNDSIYGGPGDDMVDGGPGMDLLDGSAGRDSLWGGRGDDSLIGGTEEDRLFGESGQDYLDGGEGDDLIKGGSENDTIDGSDGPDSLWGGEGNDVLAGGAERDWLYGEAGDDTVAGGDGNDMIFGNGTIEPITDSEASSDNDILDGGPGDDVFGDSGDNDQLANGQKLAQPGELDSNIQTKQHLIDLAVERWASTLGTSWDGGRWWRYVGPQLTSSSRSDVAEATIDRVWSVATTDSAGASSLRGGFSNTNTQEEGVDEGDIVKTDGEYIYLVSDAELVIVDAWPAEELHVASRLELDATAKALYLNGDRLMVVTDASPEYCGTWSWWSSDCSDSELTVTIVDVTDRTSPEVIQETTVDGTYEDSRAVGNQVYFMVRNQLDVPRPDWSCTTLERSAEEVEASGQGVPSRYVSLEGSYVLFTRFCQYETEADYRERLEEVVQLPKFRTTTTAPHGSIETTGLLSDAEDTYASELWGGENMVTILAMDMTGETTGPTTTTTILANNTILYASTESLYVAASNSSGDHATWWTAGNRTDIYKFDLAKDDVPLVATGAVPGSPINQFAMDEQDGFFRIATTTGSSWGWRGGGWSNHVYVLGQAGEHLNVVGSIEELAPGERIYSARFLDDLGFLVTFRKVDPLFTLDLSEPTNPRVLGELKIPGFSTYLHPVGGEHLIGLGRYADPNVGLAMGLQLSLFDVSDLAKPKRVDVYSFSDERWGDETEAQQDHHAFSYFPEFGVLALPVDKGAWWGGWGGDVAGLEVFHVSPADGIQKLGDIEHDSNVRRSLRIGELLYSVSADTIKVHAILDPALEVASTQF